MKVSSITKNSFNYNYPITHFRDYFAVSKELRSVINNTKHKKYNSSLFSNNAINSTGITNINSNTYLSKGNNINSLKHIHLKPIHKKSVYSQEDLNCNIKTEYSMVGGNKVDANTQVESIGNMGISEFTTPIKNFREKMSSYLKNNSINNMNSEINNNVTLMNNSIKKQKIMNLSKKISLHKINNYSNNKSKSKSKDKSRNKISNLKQNFGISGTNISTKYKDEETSPQAFKSSDNIKDIQTEYLDRIFKNAARPNVIQVKYNLVSFYGKNKEQYINDLGYKNTLLIKKIGEVGSEVRLIKELCNYIFPHVRNAKMRKIAIDNKKYIDGKKYQVFLDKERKSNLIVDRKGNVRSSLGNYLQIKKLYSEGNMNNSKDQCKTMFNTYN